MMRGPSDLACCSKRSKFGATVIVVKNAADSAITAADAAKTGRFLHVFTSALPLERGLRLQRTATELALILTRTNTQLFLELLAQIQGRAKTSQIGNLLQRMLTLLQIMLHQL